MIAEIAVWKTMVALGVCLLGMTLFCLGMWFKLDAERSRTRVKNRLIAAYLKALEPEKKGDEGRDV